MKAEKKISQKHSHLIPINNQKGFALLSMFILFFGLSTLAYCSFRITKSYNKRITYQMTADKCSLAVSARKAKIFTKIKLLNNRIKELHVAIAALRASMIVFPLDAPALKTQEETLKNLLKVAVKAQDTLIKTAGISIRAAWASQENLECVTKGTFENPIDAFSIASLERVENPALPDLDGWLNWKSRCPDRDEKVVYFIIGKAKSATTSVKRDSIANQEFQARFIRDLQDETYECENRE